jgi:acetoacetate decarboxylase
VSELVMPSAIRPGSGTPFTDRGRSVAYGPPPWRMQGRTMALWYLLADPAEARRHVPALLEMDPDPVVRARFWDMRHDAVPGEDGPGTRWTPFREAVVAFPVRLDELEGDLPTYMYADDFAYTAFGREVMGWPVRDGRIEVEPDLSAEPAAGLRLEGRLVRDGRVVMEAAVELSGRRLGVDDAEPPRWLAVKSIPDVAHPAAAISQLVVTGPERIHHRAVWEATGRLAFHEGPTDELHFLAPREIVAAQLWTDVDLTVGWGRVLRDLGPGGDGRG